MVILKCLEDKSVISVSLRLISRYFIFILFRTYSPVSSYFLSLCVSFFALDKTTNTCSLYLVVLCKSWTFLISLTQAPGCPSNFCDFSKPPSLFLVSLSSWGCAKTNQCPKGEDYSQHLGSGLLVLAPKSATGKVCNLGPSNEKVWDRHSFVLPLHWAQVYSHGKVLLCTFRYCFLFVCLFPVVLWDLRVPVPPIRVRWFGGPFLVWKP